MKIRTIKYFIAEAFRGILRNSLMAASSAVTVAACVTIVVVSYCAAANIGHILKHFEETIGVTAFIDDSLSNDNISALYYALVDIPHVKAVDYISRQQALEKFAESMTDEESREIIAGFENDNPLRRSFEITVDDIKNQAAVVERLKSPEMTGLGVAKVNEAQDAAGFLMAAENTIRIVSVCIILVLGLLSVAIITNTIKLTVNSRKNEIMIMKYIGATDGFIKTPFVIEGALIGLIGSALPPIIALFLYDGLIGFIRKSEFINRVLVFLDGGSIFPFLIPIVLLMGAVIGVIGSLTSIKRHLNV